MKNSARLALTLVASTLTVSALAPAQTFVAPSAMTPVARTVSTRARRPMIAPNAPTLIPGAVAPMIPAAPACAPLREVSLGHGVTQLTLAPASANACAPAASIAQGSTAQETLRVRITARVAAMVSSTGGALQLFNEQGTATALQTSVGACGAGLHVGVAILDPGVYVLRAPGTAGGARQVSFEAVALRGAATVERAGASETSLSTGGSDSGGTCDSGEGVDVRVLACPARAATIRAERGAVVSMESASTGRTCFSAPAGASTQAAVPSGRIVVVRAFAMGASRGAVSVSLR